MGDHVRFVTENIANEIQLRKQRNQEREQKRLLFQSTNSSEFLLPANIDKEFHRQRQEPIYEDLVGKFKRGEHLFRNEAKEQLVDLDREARLSKEAARLIHYHYAPMDDSSSTIGSTTATKKPKELMDEDELTNESIAKSRRVVDLFLIAQKKRAELLRLRTSITDMEDESEAIMAALEETRKEDTFDWQIERQGRLRHLRESIAVNKELIEALKEVDNLKSHPFLSSYIRVEGEDEEDIADHDSNQPHDNSSMTRVPVKAWIVGKLTKEGELMSIAFGQFIRDPVPPTEGWIYVGHLMQKHRNLQFDAPAAPGVAAAATKDKGSTGLSNKSLTSGNSHVLSSTLAEGSITSTSLLANLLNGSLSTVSISIEGEYPTNPLAAQPVVSNSTSFSYDDPVLAANMRKSTLCIIPLKQIDMSARKATSTTTSSDMTFDKDLASGSSTVGATGSSQVVRAYSVTGSFYDGINGRYLYRGVHNDAPKYINQSGWSIFRVNLVEIPELGIFADGCYDALRGPSVLELLEKKANRAFAELVDPKSTYLEGTVQFRHRFAELSRYGTRTITADQIMQSIRNENVKAQVRFEANEALLFMLQALAESNPLGGTNQIDEESGGQLDSSRQGSPGSMSPTTKVSMVESPRLLGTSTGGLTSPNASSKLRPISGTSGKRTLAAVGKTKSVSFSNTVSSETDIGSSATDFHVQTGTNANEGVVTSGTAGSKRSKTTSISNSDSGVQTRKTAKLSAATNLPTPTVTRQSSTVSAQNAKSKVSVSTPGSTLSKQTQLALKLAVESTSTDVAVTTGMPGNPLGLHIGSFPGSTTDVPSNASESTTAVEVSTNAAQQLSVGVSVPESLAEEENTPITDARAEHELNTKVILGHNIEYQKSSHAYMASKQRYFREREHELTADVLRRIEERESILMTVRIEAERMQRKYLDQHSTRAMDSSSRDMLIDFSELVKRLRESTINVAEALGAWIRLCQNEKSRLEAGKRQIAAHNGTKREYCVAIAKKGRVIIPASSEVLSTSILFKRGREEAVNAVDVEFVGVYPTREEAVQAFGLAMARIPSEQAYISAEDNSVSVCLRYCRKHFLVRSQKVPSDLPCEVCAAQSHAHPDSVVPLLNKHGEYLPRFVWKGRSYIDKMWSDSNFLTENVFLQQALPEYQFKSNPLLLPVDHFKHVLQVLSSAQTEITNGSTSTIPNKHSSSIGNHWSLQVLTDLKGAKERTVDAAEAGTIRIPVRGRWDHMGTIYRSKSAEARARGPADGSSSIARVGEVAEAKTQYVGGTVDRLKSKVPKALHYHSSSDMFQTMPALASNQYDGSPTLFSQTAPGFMYGHSPDQFTAISNAASPDKSPTRGMTRAFSTGSVGSGLGATTPGLSSGFCSRPSTSSFSMRRISSEYLFEDNTLGDDRIFRSLTVLGQATSLTRGTLATAVAPAKDHKLSEATILEINKLRKSYRKKKIGQTHGSDETSDNVELLKAILSGTDIDINRELGFVVGPSGSIERHGGSQTEVSGPGNATTGRILGTSSEFYTPSDAKKTKFVSTRYSHMGASLAIVQSREPVAHRVEDIWCRTDVGEWAGLTKGRAMRSFEFQENLLIEGRKKIQARKLLQDRMRKSIEYDFVACDVPLIQKLIVEAETIAKIVLGLDIIALKNYLRRRELGIKCCIMIQSLHRGRKARKLFKAMKAAHAVAKLRVRLTRRFSQELSRSYIPPLIESVLKKCVKKQMRPVLSTTVSLSGERYMITVYQLTRFNKKSFRNICPSCRTKSSIQRLDVVTGLSTVERAVCTCQQIQSSERWLFKVVDPLDCVVSERVFSMEEMENIIETICQTVGNPPEWDLSQLELTGDIGSVFQSWYQGTPLGPQMTDMIRIWKKSPSGVALLQKKYWRALLQISRESSVLGRLPHSFTKHTLNAIRNGFSASSQYPYSMTTTTSSKSVTNIDCIEIANPFEHSWDPILDYRKSLKQLDDAFVKLHDLQYRTDLARLDLEFADADRYGRVANLLDQVEMVHEDSRSTLVRTQLNLQEATDRIKDVMKFTKELHEDFESHEKDLKEDWKQSWEEFENGSAWIDLNNKRKIEKILLNHAENYAIKSAELMDFMPVVAKADKKLQAAVAWMTHMTTQLMDWLAAIKRLEAAAKSTRVSCHEILKSVASTMSFPTKPRIKPSMRLQTVPPSIVTMRDPLMRTMKQYRAGWRGLMRAVLPIRGLKVLSGQSLPVHRTLIEIWKDPVTDYILITFGEGRNSSDGFTQEACQHVDLDLTKSSLSDLNTYCLDNEIVLRPNDIARLFSRNPYWPDTEPVIKQQVTYPSHCLSLIEKQRAETLAALEAAVETGTASRREVVGATSIQSDQTVESVSITERDVCKWTNRKAVQPIPRKITTVISHNLENPEGALLSTYQQRRAKKIEDELVLAKKLASYLRLNVHTGRPSIGLESFYRRYVHLSKLLVNTMWFQDLLMGRSIAWCNQVFKKYKSEISNQPAKTTIQIFLKVVEIRLIAGNKMSELRVPLEYLLHRMAERPLLMMSFLNEIIVNKFSYDSMAFVLDQIDLQLPGGGPRATRWRAPFPSETPAIRFLRDRNDKYRGPPFVVHRFISGKYFRARFLTTVSDDIKLELGEPMDGNFWAHRYDGELLQCYISQDELRAFVANASIKSKLVPQYLKNSIGILKMEYRYELFNLLLDAIVLDPDIVKGGEVLSWRQLGGYWRPEPSIAEIVRKGFADFNNWTKRCPKGSMDPVTEPVMASALSYVDALTVRPKWKLVYNKEIPKKRLVETHSGIWAVIDTNKYYGIDSDDAETRAMKLLMQAPCGAAGSLFRSLKSRSDDDSVESYWALRFLTDETKDAYHVELRPASVSDNITAQRFLSLKERDRMSEEDIYSRRARSTARFFEQQCFVASELRKRRQVIEQVTRPQLKILSKKSDLILAYLRNTLVTTIRELDYYLRLHSNYAWDYFVSSGSGCLKALANQSADIDESTFLANRTHVFDIEIPCGAPNGVLRISDLNINDLFLSMKVDKYFTEDTEPSNSTEGIEKVSPDQEDGNLESDLVVNNSTDSIVDWDPAIQTSLVVEAQASLVPSTPSTPSLNRSSSNGHLKSLSIEYKMSSDPIVFRHLPDSARRNCVFLNSVREKFESMNRKLVDFSDKNLDIDSLLSKLRAAETSNPTQKFKISLVQCERFMSDHLQWKADNRLRFRQPTSSGPFNSTFRSYRDYKPWQRVFHGGPAAAEYNTTNRTMSRRVLNIAGKRFILIQPRVGPFDIVGARLYCPESLTVWQLLLTKAEFWEGLDIQENNTRTPQARQQATEMHCRSPNDEVVQPSCPDEAHLTTDESALNYEYPYHVIDNPVSAVSSRQSSFVVDRVPSELVDEQTGVDPDPASFHQQSISSSRRSSVHEVAGEDHQVDSETSILPTAVVVSVSVAEVAMARQCAHSVTFLALSRGILAAAQATTANSLVSVSEELHDKLLEQEADAQEWKDILFEIKHSGRALGDEEVDLSDISGQERDSAVGLLNQPTAAKMDESQTAVVAASKSTGKSGKGKSSKKGHGLEASNVSMNAEGSLAAKVPFQGSFTHVKNVDIGTDDAKLAAKVRSKRQDCFNCGTPLSSSIALNYIQSVKNALVYAMVIPSDESVTYVPKVTNYVQWQDICKEYIADGEIDRYVRTTTLSGIVFCAHRKDCREEPLPNVRLNKWIYEYQSHLGWRKSPRELTKMARLRVKDHALYSEHIPTIYGDAIILLRYGQIDFEKMKIWLVEKNRELKELKELKRRQQEGVRNERLLNHARFRENVFSLARQFVPSFERMFNGLAGQQFHEGSKHPTTGHNVTSIHSIHSAASGAEMTAVSGVNTTTSAHVHHLSDETAARVDVRTDVPLTRLHVRLLLTAFANLRAKDDAVLGAAHGSTRARMADTNTLDEAFLIDSDPVETDDYLLLRFRLPPQTPSLVFFLRSVEIQFLNDLDLARSGSLPSDPKKRLALELARYAAPSPTDFHPRVGHVIYGIFLCHCFHCTLPTNFCKFPGCGQARIKAKTRMEEIEDQRAQRRIQKLAQQGDSCPDNEEEDAPLELWIGSGLHPLEIAVKEFLLDSKSFFNDNVLTNEADKAMIQSDLLYLRSAVEEIEAERLAAQHSRLGYTQVISTPSSGELVKFVNHDGSVLEHSADVKDDYPMGRLSLTITPEVALDRRSGLKWRDLREASYRYRYLDRRAMRPEISDGITWKDIITAHSGRHAEIDELSMTESSMRQGDKLLSELVSDEPDYHVDDISTDTKNHDLVKLREGDSNNGKDDPNKFVEIYVIPTHIVAGLLAGKRGADTRGTRIPYKHIDPYPPLAAIMGTSPSVQQGNYNINKIAEIGHIFKPQERDSSGDRRPMSSVLCSWLVSKLVLFRPEHIPEMISGDRGQHLDAVVGLKLDRLHLESVSVLSCGSLVTLQFMHGVFKDANLSNDAISGCPHGAMRYCPMHLLGSLQPGLTILVGDARSSVSVACSLHGLVLSRTAAAFKLPETDIPMIAVKLNQLASKVFRLTRVGFRCTSVSLDLESVIELYNRSTLGKRGRSTKYKAATSTRGQPGNVLNAPSTISGYNPLASTKLPEPIFSSSLQPLDDKKKPTIAPRMGRRSAVVDKRAARLLAAEALVQSMNR